MPLSPATTRAGRERPSPPGSPTPTRTRRPATPPRTAAPRRAACTRVSEPCSCRPPGAERPGPRQEAGSGWGEGGDRPTDGRTDKRVRACTGWRTQAQGAGTERDRYRGWGNQHLFGSARARSLLGLVGVGGQPPWRAQLTTPQSTHAPGPPGSPAPALWSASLPGFLGTQQGHVSIHRPPGPSLPGPETLHRTQIVWVQSSGSPPLFSRLGRCPLDSFRNRNPSSGQSRHPLAPSLLH